MDGHSTDGRKWRQEPHGVLGRKSEDIFAFADDDKGLFILVVGVDIFKRDGGKVGWKFCCKSDRKWHSPLQLRICTWSVIFLVIVVSRLSKKIINNDKILFDRVRFMHYLAF